MTLFILAPSVYIVMQCLTYEHTLGDVFVSCQIFNFLSKLRKFKSNTVVKWTFYPPNNSKVDDF